MLADIQAFRLLASRNAQADGLLDDPEQPVAQDEHRDEGSADGDRLRAQLVKAARVEKSALADAVELSQRGGREESAAEGAPNPGQSVRRKGAHWVVEHPVEGEHSNHYDHPCHRADDDAGPRLDVARRRCYGD